MILVVCYQKMLLDLDEGTDKSWMQKNGVAFFVEFMYDLIQCKDLCERDKIVELKLCVQT